MSRCFICWTGNHQVVIHLYRHLRISDSRIPGTCHLKCYCTTGHWQVEDRRRQAHLSRIEFMKSALQLPQGRLHSLKLGWRIVGMVPEHGGKLKATLFSRGVVILEELLRPLRIFSTFPCRHIRYLGTGTWWDIEVTHAPRLQLPSGSVIQTPTLATQELECVLYLCSLSVITVTGLQVFSEISALRRPTTWGACQRSSSCGACSNFLARPDVGIETSSPLLTQ